MMISKVICGLKLTHDGAICLIDGNRLIFSVEMEKINNNSRHASIDDLTIIDDICKQYGYNLSDIDLFAVDGWWENVDEDSGFRYQNHNRIFIKNQGKQKIINLAYYKEYDFENNFIPALKEWNFNKLPICDKKYPYVSYMHVTGHIMSSYCTSPFAEKNQDAYILVWDGGTDPQLYYINADKKDIISYGKIFRFIGNIYTVFSSYYEPYKANAESRLYDLSIAGKIMAYIALGEVLPDIVNYLRELYEHIKEKNISYFEIYFSQKAAFYLNSKLYRHQDILCSFHYFIEELLLSSLNKYANNKRENLCITGGCALNIKWNSAIRDSGLFDKVYVSPFPNDAGSAIGAACTALYLHTDYSYVHWNVYSGPHYTKNTPSKGWEQKPCDISQLAKLLYETEKPVVVQNCCAELGPRALGNRSILGIANKREMKDTLNRIKKREYYRPVSPICIEERASCIFDPGSPDPFMLFDHSVKKEWRDKIPAICHLDGSARLQTVNKEQNAVIYELLLCYESISGLPVLCNTSANYLGKGFFPDIFSATEWAGVSYIWYDNTLYFKDKT